MKEVERISKNKKGLSTIVATLLILLLIFVAVGIIWVVVRNVIQEGSEQISLGKFTLDLKISKVQITDDSTIRVKVKRNPGTGDFIALNFIVSDGDDSEVIRIEDSLLELEETSYNLLLENLNASNLETLQVAPIFLLESGKEVVGPIKDEYKYGTSSGSGYVCTPSCPTTAQCGSDGCGGTCGSCSSGYVCNSTYQCVTQESCTDTCSSLGYVCGTVCGVDCGNCTLPGATSSCSSGSCIISSCLTGYANCDSTDANGCETQLGTNSNCGSCGDVCSSSETCTNGVCIEESTCEDTCLSLGFECGTQTVCGSDEDCGSCDTDETCNSEGECVALLTPTTAKIVDVYASSFEEGNPPENTLDGDLNYDSRWSSQYDGEWIAYVLNQTVTINEVSIAFYNGDSRVATFSVEVSTDNSTWIRVLDHEDSSGSSLAFETFSFSEINARYVQIIGHENSYNDWNSFTEVEIENFVSEI